MSDPCIADGFDPVVERVPREYCADHAPFQCASYATVETAADCKHNSRRKTTHRRGGRVVECTGLENQQGFVALRGFESHPLRQYLKSPIKGLFRYWKRVREFESCSTKWRSYFGRTQCARRVSHRRWRINPTCRKRPLHGAFLFFSPSVVEDENPVRQNGAAILDARSAPEG